MSLITTLSNKGKAGSSSSEFGYLIGSVEIPENTGLRQEKNLFCVSYTEQSEHKLKEEVPQKPIHEQRPQKKNDLIISL